MKIVTPKFLSEQTTITAAGGSLIVSPMPGICDKILVKPGDSIEAGSPVAVIIAMKMEHVLKAPRKGVVKLVGATAGKNVAKGEVIVRLVDEEVE